MEPATIIAITGGIGSGKSYVCRLLERYGIEVYDCDAAAKRLLRSDAELMNSISALVGPQVYSEGRLQKQVLATFLLANEANSERLNNLVHPAVARDFLESGYRWVESAILFDSGFDLRIHPTWVIGVLAPEEVRLHRVMERDHLTAPQAQAWLNKQLPQAEVAHRCHFCINNDGQQPLAPQIEHILQQIK